MASRYAVVWSFVSEVFERFFVSGLGRKISKNSSARAKSPKMIAKIRQKLTFLAGFLDFLLVDIMLLMVIRRL